MIRCSQLRPTRCRRTIPTSRYSSRRSGICSFDLFHRSRLIRTISEYEYEYDLQQLAGPWAADHRCVGFRAGPQRRVVHRGRFRSAGSRTCRRSPRAPCRRSICFTPEARARRTPLIRSSRMFMKSTGPLIFVFDPVGLRRAAEPRVSRSRTRLAIDRRARCSGSIRCWCSRGRSRRTRGRRDGAWPLLGVRSSWSSRCL